VAGDASSLRARFPDAGIDALWVTSPANVRYLSGFTSPEDGSVLVTQAASTLFTDGRYTVQAAEESRIPHLIWKSVPRVADVKDQVQGLRIGVEAGHLTLAGAEQLREAWGVELVPTKRLVEELRLVKSEAELARVAEAARLTDAAFEHALDLVKPGVREDEVALRLEVFFKRQGAQPWPHGFVVASGPRSAMPHGRASSRVIESGDLVTLDFGCLFEGYHSDLTRTIAVGEVGAEQRRWYDETLAAQQSAVHAVKAGITGKEVDAVARERLTAAGLGEAFAHSTGHGVGLEIHEAPRLAAHSTDTLAPGMVVTVEPGVYFPGAGGVRIEDLVAVTTNGPLVLSHSRRELISVSRAPAKPAARRSGPQSGPETPASRAPAKPAARRSGPQSGPETPASRAPAKPAAHGGPGDPSSEHQRASPGGAGGGVRQRPAPRRAGRASPARENEQPPASGAIHSRRENDQPGPQSGPETPASRAPAKPASKAIEDAGPAPATSEGS
jgi:Xaa-Pro aminopeptidase/Xaa-Pro dipeptidase